MEPGTAENRVTRGPVTIKYVAAEPEIHDVKADGTWSKEFKVEKNKAASVGASPRDRSYAGSITCEIQLDGQTVKKQTHKGYATCSFFGR